MSLREAGRGEKHAGLWTGLRRRAPSSSGRRGGSDSIGSGGWADGWMKRNRDATALARSRRCAPLLPCVITSFDNLVRAFRFCSRSHYAVKEC